MRASRYSPWLDHAKLARIDFIPIGRFAHEHLDQGANAMELVSWLAGEPWSSSPECACPVIGTFVRCWGDDIEDVETRTQLLRPFLALIVGSKATPAIEWNRAAVVADWLAREHLPTWLELRPGLKEPAARVRASRMIVDTPSAVEASQVVRDAHAAAISDAESIEFEKCGVAAASDAVDAAGCNAAARAASAGGPEMDQLARAAQSASFQSALAAAYDAARLPWMATTAPIADRPSARQAASSAGDAAARSVLAKCVRQLQISAVVLVSRLLALGDTDDWELQR